MLFIKDYRDAIVNLGTRNLSRIRDAYLKHQKIKNLSKTQLDQYQKMIGEIYSKQNTDFYSTIQDFWSQLYRNTEEYSKEMKEIFDKSIVENSKNLENYIISNFTNPFLFFENINQSFEKSNSLYFRLSEKNLEDFKVLIEKLSNLIKEFSINCEEIISFFEVKNEAS